MDPRKRYATAVDAFNSADPVGFAAIYAEDAIVHDPLYAHPLHGRSAIEQDAVEVRRAMPDARFTLREALQEGATVAVEYELRGTHLGPLALPDGEVAPTGRTLHILGAVVARFDHEGFVLEERRYFDVAGLLAQVGVPVG